MDTLSQIDSHIEEEHITTQKQKYLKEKKKQMLTHIDIIIPEFNCDVEDCNNDFDLNCKCIIINNKTRVIKV